MLYRLVALFLQLVARVFFRQIEIAGRENIPVTGPVIFVGNHPNSLLDPLMIISTSCRRISFAAKDVLFKYVPLRILFMALGAVPIRRKQDHTGQQQLDNNQAFEALFGVLKNNGCMGIFPEGISHISSELAPIKTGAARIALGVQNELAAGQTLQIIPCGLTYKRRRRMRGNVLVQYGAAITIDAFWHQKFKENEKEAVQELTTLLEKKLRSLTINADDFETLRVLHAARRIYRPEQQKLSFEEHNLLMRRFIEHYENLKNVPEVRQVFTELSAFQYEMDLAGITDHQLRHAEHSKKLQRKLIRHFLLLFWYLPLAIPGILIHFPIILVAVFAGENLSPRKDVIATTKVMSATFFVLMFYILFPLLPLAMWPWPLGLYVFGYLLFLLPTSGWCTIRLLERQAFLRRGMGVWLKLIKNKEVITYLKEERNRLKKRIQTLVDAHMDPALPRVVPKDAN